MKNINKITQKKKKKKKTLSKLGGEKLYEKGREGRGKFMNALEEREMKPRPIPLTTLSYHLCPSLPFLWSQEKKKLKAYKDKTFDSYKTISTYIKTHSFTNCIKPSHMHTLREKRTWHFNA